MTLPKFAAECQCLQHDARSNRSISAADAGNEQQSRQLPLLLSIDGTNQWTN